MALPPAKRQRTASHYEVWHALDNVPVAAAKSLRPTFRHLPGMTSRAGLARVVASMEACRFPAARTPPQLLRCMESVAAHSPATLRGCWRVRKGEPMLSMGPAVCHQFLPDSSAQPRSAPPRVGRMPELAAPQLEALTWMLGRESDPACFEIEWHWWRRLELEPFRVGSKVVIKRDVLLQNLRPAGGRSLLTMGDVVRLTKPGTARFSASASSRKCLAMTRTNSIACLACSNLLLLRS